MRARLRRQTPILVTAAVVALLVSLGPQAAMAAYDAVNSDKVDGKHAVGAGASATKRAGKLVATDGSGRLPNGIIAKAPDSDRLDGHDSSELLLDSVGSVDSTNVADGSLQPADLDPATTRPTAYGLVLSDGTQVAGRPWAGITSVTRPDGTDGLYCIDIAFAPRAVSVTSSMYFSGPAKVAVTYDVDGGCPEGTDLRVYTYPGIDYTSSDASFEIQVWG